MTTSPGERGRWVIDEPSRQMLGGSAMVTLHVDGEMVIRYAGLDLGYSKILERHSRAQIVPVVRPKPLKRTRLPTRP